MPVIEAHPDIMDDYLAIIKEPMDFHTIEENLSQYTHIHEMQDDLVLTFRNCCEFNGENSDLYAQAIQIWLSLNEIFQQACEENRVHISFSYE